MIIACSSLEMFSDNRTCWSTPQEFFDALDTEFGFTLDVAALPGTAKCRRFFSPEDNGLNHDWSQDVFWMNPPYGRGQDVYQWVEKAFLSARDGGTGVCLLPASTETKWFHDFCMKASEIRFVRDRLWFSLSGKTQRANHAAVIVVFTPAVPTIPRISTMTNCRERRKAEELPLLTQANG